MLTAAILPVKSFARAKQRLGPSLIDQQRERLARAMVGDVLQALTGSEQIDLTIVVTAEPWAGEAATQLGATVLPDETERGQSAAAEVGIAHAAAEGFARVLCVPGDCPALDIDELDRLLAAHEAERQAVVIVPDRHGSGTNGLLLFPPGAIAPSFGPDSRERHLGLARTAACSCVVVEVSSLSLDIDTGADLAVLREHLGELGDRAQRTRSELAGPAFSGSPLAARA